MFIPLGLSDVKRRGVQSLSFAYTAAYISTLLLTSQKMPLDLLAHGAALVAGVKAMPALVGKVASLKGSATLAADKAKLTACFSEGDKAQVATDLKELENDLDIEQKSILAIPTFSMDVFSRKAETRLHMAEVKSKRVTKASASARRSSCSKFLWHRN